MNNNKLRNWNDIQKELFTPEEIAESALRVEIIGALIKARQEQGDEQKSTEDSHQK